MVCVLTFWGPFFEVPCCVSQAEEEARVKAAEEAQRKAEEEARKLRELKEEAARKAKEKEEQDRRDAMEAKLRAEAEALIQNNAARNIQRTARGRQLRVWMAWEAQQAEEARLEAEAQNAQAWRESGSYTHLTLPPQA